jgi:hypothetical protein
MARSYSAYTKHCIADTTAIAAAMWRTTAVRSRGPGKADVAYVTAVPPD